MYLMSMKSDSDASSKAHSLFSSGIIKPETLGRDFEARLAFPKIDICHNMTLNLTGLQNLEVNLRILRSEFNWKKAL